MALIRLTADNAQEVIQQIVGDFAELVRSTGKSPALLKLGENTEELERLTGAAVLEVEVLLGEVSERWRDAIAKWLQIDRAVLDEAISSNEPVELTPDLDRKFSVARIRSSAETAGRRAGHRVPPILVVVHTPEQAPEQEIKDAIFDAVQQHPLSLLLVPAEAGWAKALANLASRDQWMCKAIGLELLSERSLEENLQLPPWKDAATFMVGWSAVSAMHSLYSALELALEKERRSLKSKRTLLDQKVAVDQQKSTGNPSDIIGHARTHIQRSFDTFQRQSSQRLQSVVGQFDGTLSQEVEGKIKDFHKFDYEKKPKTFVVRVPEAVKKGLLSRVKEALSEAGTADLVSMGETFRRVQEEVEKLIEADGGPPTVVHFNYLPDHELTNLVQRSVGIQRPYMGTLARRGPMDYFMAARRYQMIFFMMFSAFGLSFIRSYRQVMVPLTVLLLSFGLLNVVNSTRKQEKETEELELEKARELLRSELRRCMNEVEKTWSSIVSSHLSSEQSKALEKIETTVHSYFEGASRKAADNKALQQRQIKSLDQAERRVTEAFKKVQTAPQELEQLSSQLTDLYVAVTRPGEAAPRIPGAPAVPGVARPAAGPVKAAAPAQVPAAAAAALEKLKAAKAGKGKIEKPKGRTPDDPRQRLAKMMPKGSKEAAGKPEDVAQKLAALKERAAAAAAKSKASAPPAVAKPEVQVADKQTPEAQVDPKGKQRDSDRGAQMKKKAEEIKRKMAEAAASGQGGSSDSDKTVMLPKRPSPKNGESAD